MNRCCGAADGEVLPSRSMADCTAAILDTLLSCSVCCKTCICMYMYVCIEYCISYLCTWTQVILCIYVYVHVHYLMPVSKPCVYVCVCVCVCACVCVYHTQKLKLSWESIEQRQPSDDVTTYEYVHVHNYIIMCAMIFISITFRKYMQCRVLSLFYMYVQT